MRSQMNGILPSCVLVRYGEGEIESVVLRAGMNREKKKEEEEDQRAYMMSNEV